MGTILGKIMQKILLFFMLSIISTAPVFCALPAAKQRPTNSPITRCDHIEICAKASCIAASYAIIPCGLAGAFYCCSQCAQTGQHSLYYEKAQQAVVGYKICAAGLCFCGIEASIKVFRSEVHRLQQNKTQSMHRD